ncbi:MAG: hypothetical protein KDC52_17470, partial [Ignavibacteriae bacterium]|nr:hypothetical protein [Ignavibacteriota bacterium]
RHIRVSVRHNLNKNQSKIKIMSEQAIRNSLEQELRRNLAARYDRNNENLDMDDIVKEAAFTMAVNILISEKQLKEQTNGQIQFMPSESLNMMFNCLNQVMNKISGDFHTYHFQQIKNKYEEIMSDSNAKNRVNSHYNELYGSNGGNVI